MRPGDYVTIDWIPGGRGRQKTGGILRHTTAVSVVLEPAEGESRHRRIPWTQILEVSRIHREG